VQSDQLIYSASMLQDYVDCQRRFELKYIRKQSWPSIPIEPVLEMEELIAHGRQFHFLAHQLFAGVPQSSIKNAITDATLREWFDRFVIFYDQQSWKQNLSELQITSHLNHHRLIAVYDLIVETNDGKIAIYDWKTSLHPPKKEFLKSKMQSLIYPFILFENMQSLFPSSANSDLSVISMTYWYPAFPETLISFEYDLETHQHNRDLLQNLLEEIHERMQTMQFHKTDNLRMCKYCQYRSLCDRGISAGTTNELFFESGIDEVLIDFDALPDMDADV
jgi:CRISPR/Cas system-associated exonuclease Cas4 (RecB family)